MKLAGLFCGFLLAATASASTHPWVAQDYAVHNRNVMAGDGWTWQCTFDFKQWVGTVYVDTVTVYQNVTKSGVTASRVAVEGLEYKTDECDGEALEGSVRVEVTSGSPRDRRLDTGNLSIGGREVTLEKDFDGVQLSSCRRARVTTTTWCESDED